MLMALAVLFLITAGGFALTLLFDGTGGFWTRVCAGAVIGQVLFSLVGLLLGSLVGTSGGVATIAVILTALPVLLLSNEKRRRQVRAEFADFARAGQDFVWRPTFGNVIWTFVYAGLMLMLWLFFERAMLNINGGIGTGSMHNTGDLSFHLQAIYGFLDGQNYPPQNPSFAGAKFTYPFMADLVTAMLALFGVKISEAMFWQNMVLAVALIGTMRHFTLKLTGNHFAANIAPLLLLFDGGLGFIYFFKDAAANDAGFYATLMKMPFDYTIRPDHILRWGNSLTTLFMTQRSLLLGLPLALVILTKLWELFSEDAETKGRSDAAITETSIFPASLRPFVSPSLFIVGLLAGTLPLVHAHSFAVVMGMAACLTLMNLRRLREWAAFFLASGLIAIPELLWATTGSASKAANFVDWKTGWDNGDNNVIWFWFVNTGFFIPLLLVAVALLIVESRKSKAQSPKTDNESFIPYPSSLILFYLPFVLCFIVPNAVRLAPWVWDNVKVLIYWFVVSVPLVAYLLAQIWRRGAVAGKVFVILLLGGLMLSGWLDVFRIASAQLAFTVFDRDAVDLAREARKIMPPNARIAGAPTHDSPAALTGRRWFLGYTGHLWSHGIDPTARENALHQIYFGGHEADELLRENGIDYLIVGTRERNYTALNDEYLRRFPVVAEAGEYTLLQVK